MKKINIIYLLPELKGASGGAKVIYNENSEIVKYIVPFKYRKNLILKGVYGKNLPFIQQESTFWKKKFR